MTISELEILLYLSQYDKNFLLLINYIDVRDSLNFQETG